MSNLTASLHPDIKTSCLGSQKYYSNCDSGGNIEQQLSFLIAGPGRSRSWRGKFVHPRFYLAFVPLRVLGHGWIPIRLLQRLIIKLLKVCSGAFAHVATCLLTVDDIQWAALAPSVLSGVIRAWAPCLILFYASHITYTFVHSLYQHKSMIASTNKRMLFRNARSN